MATLVPPPPHARVPPAEVRVLPARCPVGTGQGSALLAGLLTQALHRPGKEEGSRERSKVAASGREEGCRRRWNPLPTGQLCVLSGGCC